MQLLDMYQQENEWAKGAALLQPLIDEDPLNLEMQRQQAFFYLRAGDARNARDRFRALVQADPKDARSLFYLAEALNDLEEHSEAETIFRKLLQADPNDTDVLASFALSLSGQKKWDEATQTFQKLLTAGDLPEHLGALARTQLAYIDLQKENYAAAVEMAKSIFVFRDKPNTQAINIALEALKKQEKYADTVTLLEPLVQSFDRSVRQRALRRSADALGQKEQSRAACGRADEDRNAQHDCRVRGLRAGGRSRGGDCADEGRFRREADELDLQFQLGSLFERAGDTKSAEATFVALLKKGSRARAVAELPRPSMWPRREESRSGARDARARGGT
jgi:Tfp pilus assembly protein PilF